MEPLLSIGFLVSSIAAILAVTAWRTKRRQCANLKIEMLIAATYLTRAVQEQNRKSHAAANQNFRKALNVLERTLAADMAKHADPDSSRLRPSGLRADDKALALSA